MRRIIYLKSKLSHRHYAIIITVSSAACGVIGLRYPEYNGHSVVLATLTNIFWVWE